MSVVRLRQSVAVVAALAYLCCASLAPAQDEKKADKKGASKAAESKDLTVETSDFVQLKITYYPGAKAKEAAAVVMVHGAEGTRKDFDGLAKLVQAEGHCALAVDLRGFGESTEVRPANSEKSIKISAKTFKPINYDQMWKIDLEAIKNFLIKKNNEGEVNIEKLCLVGADMGALVALNYAAEDWSYPDLGPQNKQGRDVKALVLLSPPPTYKNLRSQAALAHPAVRAKLAVLTLVGAKDKTQAGNATRVFASLSRYHKSAEDSPGLFLAELGTTLQGTKLLGDEKIAADKMTSPQGAKQFGEGDTKPRAEDLILQFLDARLGKKKTPWASRE